MSWAWPYTLPVYIWAQPCQVLAVPQEGILTSHTSFPCSFPFAAAEHGVTYSLNASLSSVIMVGWCSCPCAWFCFHLSFLCPTSGSRLRCVSCRAFVPAWRLFLSVWLKHWILVHFLCRLFFFFFTLVVVVCLSCNFSASLWLSSVSRWSFSIPVWSFCFSLWSYGSLKTFLVFYSPSCGSSASIHGPLIDFLTKRYLWPGASTVRCS